MSRLYWPVSELIDRLSITMLKSERILDHDSSEDYKILAEEANRIAKERGKVSQYGDWLFKLKVINGKIWDAEAEIRAGLEEKISAEEGWALCIRVRDLNRVRNSIKNEIVKETGEGFREVRVNCVANPNEG